MLGFEYISRPTAEEKAFLQERVAFLGAKFGKIHMLCDISVRPLVVCGKRVRRSVAFAASLMTRLNRAGF